MAEETGVWVKVWPDFTGGAPGAAVIGGATGAVTESSFTENGQAYDVYEFLGSGELVVTDPGLVDALVVGGGGGGGNNGGGGGAGGYLLVPDAYFLSEQTVVIGAGGAGAAAGSFGPGLSGDTTRCGSLYAVGGGGGGADGSAGGPGRTGGSGGGGGNKNSFPGGAEISGQGKSGGTGNTSGSSGASGGGGGGSTNGSAAIGTNAGGNGGNGIDASNFIGNQKQLDLVGGGGGGSFGGAAGTATNGGGDGTSDNTTGESGTINTGGGAGGGGYLSGSGGAGGTGGSGYVCVRVKVPTESYPFRTRTTAPKTAHAARIENGIVRQVIVIPHLDDDDAKITAYCNRIGLPGTWVDTSYTGSRRGKYAGVGDTFAMTKSGGEFVSPVVEEIEE
jgi:hypothetical protein